MDTSFAATATHPIPRFQLPVIDAAYPGPELRGLSPAEQGLKIRATAVHKACTEIVADIGLAVLEKVARHIYEDQPLEEIAAEVDRFANSQVQQLAKEVRDSLSGQPADWDAVREKDSTGELLAGFQKEISRTTEHCMRAFSVVRARDAALGADLKVKMQALKDELTDERVREILEAARAKLSGLQELLKEPEVHYKTHGFHLRCAPCVPKDFWGRGFCCTPFYGEAIRVCGNASVVRLGKELTRAIGVDLLSRVKAAAAAQGTPV